jgi:hypothetical protein
MLPLEIINTNPLFTNETVGPFIGDYIGVANSFGKTYMAWPEAQGNDPTSPVTLYFASRTHTPPNPPSGYANIKIDQKDESNSSFGKIGRWRTNLFIDYLAPADLVLQQTGEVLRASQSFKPNTTQKYNKWLGETDVVNHHSFSIAPGATTIQSNFKSASNATIRTCVGEGGLVASTVELKDPWLVDDNSDGLGPRNRGTNALFVSKSTPFYPINDGSTKGVFLGENPNFQTGVPIYTLRAVQPIHATGLEWNFSYWGASNASVSSPNSLETPVVFNSGDATVTANYNTVVRPEYLDFVGRDPAEDGKILLSWSEHPSINVTQYQIYRRVTPYDGIPGPPQLIATLNRGTTTYKDNAWYFNDEHLSYNIGYDVRCYHQPTGTYSEPNWWWTFASTFLPQAFGSASGAREKRKPTSVTFEGFPNPFNPSTKLMYSLKDDSNVDFRVYDLLGRVVAEIATGFQHAGYYSYEWNAQNLTTGVYFARLVVQSEHDPAVVLTNRLLLTK